MKVHGKPIVRYAYCSLPLLDDWIILISTMWKLLYRKRVVTHWYWVCCLVLVFLLIWISFQIRLQDLFLGHIQLLDFDAYYQMLPAVANGVSPYEISSMQTAGPPSVILPYLLLSGLSLEISRGSMTAISILSSVMACWLLARYLFPSKQVLLTLALLTLFWLTFAARFTLLMGQSNILVMFLMTVLLTKSGWPQSIALALSTILKANYLAIWPYLFRRPKVLLTSGCIVILIFLLGFWRIPLTTYQFYFSERFLSYAAMQVSAKQMDYYNQSLQASLGRIDLILLYPIVLLLLILLWMFTIWRSKNLAFGIIFSLVLSPIVWQHYFVVLFPVIVLIAWRYRSRPLLIAGCVVSYGLTMFQWSNFHQLDVNWLTGVLGSHQYLGVLLLLAILLQAEFGRKPLPKATANTENSQ